MRFLFVDRILELIPRQYIRGLKHITNEDVFLSQDKVGRSYFVPALIGESIGQLAAWNVMQANDFSYRPVAGIAASVNLVKPAYVGETLLLEAYIDKLDETAVQYHGAAKVNDEVIFSIDDALGPLLPMQQFIADSEVRQQFAEIYRPGEWLKPVPGDVIHGITPPAAILSFDRILQHEPGEFLIAEKRINRAAGYFPDHFPRKPVLPMTILLECKLNLLQEFITRAKFDRCYQLAALRKIKMNEFIVPGDSIICQIMLKQRDEQQLVVMFRSEVAGKRVCVLEVVMQAQGEQYE